MKVDTAVHTRQSADTQCLVLTGSHWVCPTGLGVLLGVALGNENLQMWTLAQDKECDLTGYLRVKLQYKNRLQYMVTGRGPSGSLFPSPKAHLDQCSLPPHVHVSPKVAGTPSTFLYHMTMCVRVSPTTISLPS